MFQALALTQSESNEELMLKTSAFESLYIGKFTFSYQLTFDQQGFAEAKAYKKSGKIYYFSTFRGDRDSIIKRLVK